MKLLIAGAGTAGIPAALTALDAGAEVILAEAQAQAGGVLWASGGMTSGAGTSLQRAKGIEDNPEVHAADIQRIGRGRANRPVLSQIVVEAPAVIEWFRALGVRFTSESPVLAGFELYSVPRSYVPAADPERGPWRGFVLAEAMQRALESRLGSDRLALRLSTRLTDLVRDPSGRVTGAVLERSSGRETVDADAVVMATGGYVASQELLRRLHPRVDRLITQAPPIATGGGLVAAERAGAEIVNTDILLPNPGGIEDPDRPGFRLEGGHIPAGRPPAASGDIWVNRKGHRFVAEDSADQAQRERAIAGQEDAVMLAVFDEPMRRGLTPEIAEWSRSRLGEPPDPRLVLSAPNLESLARQAGIPPAALISTVDRYNRAVHGGGDKFGRRSFPKPIDTPPYHSVLTRGVLIMTFAGLRTNGSFEALGADGASIPGLYAAGEVLGAGQLQGAGYSSGLMIVASAASGRLAARAACGLARAA